MASDILSGTVDEGLRKPYWGRLFGVLKPDHPEAARVPTGTMKPEQGGV